MMMIVTKKNNNDDNDDDDNNEDDDNVHCASNAPEPRCGPGAVSVGGKPRVASHRPHLWEGDHEEDGDDTCRW